MLGDNFLKSFEDRWLLTLSRGGELQRSMFKNVGNIIHKDQDNCIKHLDNAVKAGAYEEIKKKGERK